MPLFIIMMIYYLRHIYRDRHRISKSASTLFLASAILILFSTASAIPRPSSLWMRIITVITTHQSLLMVYSGIIQITQNEERPFYSRKSYVFVTALSILNIIIEYFRRDNLGSYIDDEVYRPDIIYFSSYILFYLIWLSLCIMITNQCRYLIKQSAALVYQTRATISLIAFAFASLSAVLIEINITLSITSGDAYRASLNEVYHMLKPPIGLMFLICSLPSQLLSKLLSPIRYIRTIQHEHQKALMSYLHQKIIQIAPTVHLPLTNITELDMEIEIGDARELIWSNTPHSNPITAKEEARALFTLLQHKTILDEPGEHPIPVTKYDAIKHNLMVAKHLRRLELILRVKSFLNPGRNGKDAIPKTDASTSHPETPRPPLPR